MTQDQEDQGRKKISPSAKSRASRVRIITGAAGAWLMNLAPLGFMARNVCAPGFNCHGCAWATAACPVGVLAFSASIRTLPLLALSTLLALGSGVGRLVCGFVCPFGWFQDLVHRIPSPRFRLPRWTRWGKYLALGLLVILCPLILGTEVSGFVEVAKPELAKEDGGQLRATVTVKNLGEAPVKGVTLEFRYLPLEGEAAEGEEPDTLLEPVEPRQFSEVEVLPGEAVTLPSFLLPDRLSVANLQITSRESVPSLTMPYDLYYCRLCPQGTLTSFLPYYLQSGSEASGGLHYLSGAKVLRLVILAVFLLLMVVVSRPFCQIFCPLGALYGLFARVSLIRMRLIHERCLHCGRCDQVCPVDLDVLQEVGGAECIACGECRRVCPAGAIERRIRMT